MNKSFLYKNKIFLVIILFLFLVYLYWLFNQTKEPFYNENENDNKKIAFCFLIYDSINNEELWKKFFDTADKNKYTIYIHYKQNVPLKYFENYKLKNCIDTEWGKISLVKASNILFKSAYEDPQNHKFVLLSNSCIPLKSFEQIYSKLTSDNMGYINEVEDINNKGSKIYKYDPNKYGKSSQWIILNREMVKEIAFYDENLINYNFGDVYAPDEVYYCTMIKHKNLYNEVVVAKNSATNGSTFVFWNDMEYLYSKSSDSNAPQPRAYSVISSEELNYLHSQPCMFGRKFNKDCKVLMNSEYKNLEDFMMDLYLKN